MATLKRRFIPPLQQANCTKLSVKGAGKHKDLAMKLVDFFVVFLEGIPVGNGKQIRCRK